MSDDLVKQLRFGSLTTMGSHRMNLEAADRIEALEAQLAAFQWQPIETAPRDGAAFLGYWPDNFGNDNGTPIRTWRDSGKWQNPFEAAYDDDDEYTPTHWMPLPELPKAD